MRTITTYAAVANPDLHAFTKVIIRCSETEAQRLDTKGRRAHAPSRAALNAIHQMHI